MTSGTRFRRTQDGKGISVMWASFGIVSVIPWILLAQTSWNMDAVPVISPQSSAEAAVDIQDHAHLFSPIAEGQARVILRKIHRDHGVSTRIETTSSLKGAWIADVSQRLDRMSRPDQLYILVAGLEREVGVIAARRGPASRLSDQQRESIRRAFLEPLQEDRTDEALAMGVQAIGNTLDEAASGTQHGTREMMITAAILLVSLVVYFVCQVWAWTGRKHRSHHRVDSRSAMIRHGDRPSWPGSRPLKASRSLPQRDKPEVAGQTRSLRKFGNQAEA